MNRKGQLGLGVTILSFIVIIVGLAIYSGGIAPNVGTLTQTKTNTNKTITAPSAAGQSVFIDGQRIIGSLVALNASNSSQVLPTSNYTVQSDVSTGVLRLQFTLLAGNGYAGKPLNVSYQYEPEGYISDAGARSVTSLIGIMTALAVVAIAMWAAMGQPSFREILDSFD